MAEIGVRSTARIAGALYLINAACGLWAEVFVRGRLIVSGDAASTTANILAHQMLYRSGFVADLISMIAELGITLLFYRIFSAVSRSLSAAMVLFRLVWVAIFSVVALTHIAPLLLLDGGAYIHAFSAPQLQAFSYFLLKLHNQGYEIALVFFGVDCILVGVLIWHSAFLPRFLGAAVAFAGICYLVNSLSDFLTPSLSARFGIWLLLPCALAEYALILWLILVGVNPETWREQSALQKER